MYGLQVKVDAADGGALLVEGRIVRDDGKLMRGPVSARVERMPTLGWRGQVKKGLAQVVKELDPATLPSTREPELPAVLPAATPEVTQPEARAAVAAPAPVVAPSMVRAEVEAWPATPPVFPPAVELSQPSSPLKTFGVVMTVTGAALLVGGTSLYAVGRVQAGRVLNDDGALRAGGGVAEAEQARSATTMQTLGAAAGAAGLAVGVAGVICWLRGADGGTPQVSVAPAAGGVGLALTGVLP